MSPQQRGPNKKKIRERDKERERENLVYFLHEIIQGVYSFVLVTKPVEFTQIIKNEFYLIPLN